jgi:hypothetical protein
VTDTTEIDEVVSGEIVPAEARDSSPEERQDRAEAMFAVEAAIKENLAVGRGAAWELARNLYEFNEESGWTALSYETQADWLAQPDIGMTKTEFFRMVRRYRELVINRQLDQVTLVELAPSKVDIVMPAIESGKITMQEIIDDVQQLGARDLRDKYIGLKRSKGDPAEPGDLDDDGVIEVKEVPSLDPAEKERLDAERKLWDEIRQSTGMVESWFDVGGDRRKAQRHFAKLLEVHPVFAALDTVKQVIEGSDDAPMKEVGQLAWAEITETLSLPLPDGMNG